MVQQQATTEADENQHPLQAIQNKHNPADPCLPVALGLGANSLGLGNLTPLNVRSKRPGQHPGLQQGQSPLFLPVLQASPCLVCIMPSQ
eukprot:43144-Pelagomonas_calceolata.AAC.1